MLEKFWICDWCCCHSLTCSSISWPRKRDGLEQMRWYDGFSQRLIWRVQIFLDTFQSIEIIHSLPVFTSGFLHKFSGSFHKKRPLKHGQHRFINAFNIVLNCFKTDRRRFPARVQRIVGIGTEFAEKTTFWIQHRFMKHFFYFMIHFPIVYNDLFWKNRKKVIWGFFGCFFGCFNIVYCNKRLCARSDF